MASSAADSWTSPSLEPPVDATNNTGDRLTTRLHETINGKITDGPAAMGAKCTRTLPAGVADDWATLVPDPGLPDQAIDHWEALVLEVAASKLDREQTTKRLRALLAQAGIPPGRRC